MLSFSCNVKRIFSILLMAGFISFFIFFSASARELDNYLNRKEIIVIIGETKPLSVSNPRQVKIGNPDVLDVVGAGQKELLLSGKSEGETTLVVVDDFGQYSYNVKIYKEDLEKVKERVDFLLEAAGFTDITTRIGDKERKVFILGRLPLSKKDFFESKFDSVKDKIVNLVEYEEDIPSIEVDVEVLEIEKDALDKIGLSWSDSIKFTEGGGSTGRVTGDIDSLLNPVDFFKIMKDWRTGTISATLDILKQNNKARTLSRPKIVCLSGKEAKLLIGGEIPIIKSSTTSTTSAGTSTNFDIQLKETGITLSIKPVIKENNQIQISLQTEIREVDTSTQLTLSGGVTTPGFTTRSAQTELTVMNGQTVFIAGLIKSKRKDNRASVPGLGSIPIFGMFFRHRDFELKDTELVLTLTPHIIKIRTQNEISSAKVATKDNSLKATESVSGRHLAKKDPVFDYSTLIQNIINSNLRYPKELKDKKVEGTVKLSLHLESNGKLLGIVIMRSSGSAALDEMAEHTVKKLSPFPSFPSGVRLKELWIDIPIVYEIGGSA